MELAEDIVQQPLAMRVFVNRIWRWNMGTGIVDTPNNFGFAGERPTIEKVRARLGSGSPNTITPLLEAWWKRLAGRLDAGPAA